jgi:hypothetical protein
MSTTSKNTRSIALLNRFLGICGVKGKGERVKDGIFSNPVTFHMHPNVKAKVTNAKISNRYDVFRN